MLLGCLGIIVISFVEGSAFKFINESKNRNYITFILTLSTVLGMILLSVIPSYIIKGEFDASTELSFFFSKWFYLSLFLEIAGMWLYREAYLVYKEKYTIVNMFMFSTVFLMPLYAFIMNGITGLNNKITAIDSLNEAIITSLILFVGVFVYFYNKFKLKEITDLKILVALSFCMLNAMYFSVKLIQSYNGILLYSIICFIVALNFLVTAIYKKETLEVEEKGTKFNLIVIAKTFMQFIYVKSVAFVPVEIVPIVRRLAQLSAGLVIDRKSLDKYEISGILIIVSIFIYNILK